MLYRFLGPIAAAAILAAAAIASPAAAQSQRVGFSDLDLSTERGVRELRRRIRAAAFRVCAREHIEVRGNAYTLSVCRRLTEADALTALAQRLDRAARTRLAANANMDTSGR